MGKFISGLPNNTNLDKWADYAKRNTYGDNKRQCRGQLARAGRHDAENDWSDDWQHQRRARKAAAGPISIRAVGDAPRRPPEAAFSPLRIAIHGTDSAQSINLWVPRCGDEGTSGYSFGSGCHSHGLRNCSPREYSA